MDFSGKFTASGNWKKKKKEDGPLARTRRETRIVSIVLGELYELLDAGGERLSVILPQGGRSTS